LPSSVIPRGGISQCGGIGPHVSLCRPAKPTAKGWATPHAKARIVGGHEGQFHSRGTALHEASFTFEAQISGQTDGRPRVGAKKASNEVVKFWPTRVLAYAGSCKHCLPFFISLGSFAAHQSPTTCPIPTPPGVVNCRRLFEPSFSYILRACDGPEGGRKKSGLRGFWPTRVLARTARARSLHTKNPTASPIPTPLGVVNCRRLFEPFFQNF